MKERGNGQERRAFWNEEERERNKEIEEREMTIYGFLTGFSFCFRNLLDFVQIFY